jgi:hypothetical protein
MPKVRVLRILEYVGEHEAIEFHLNQRSVKGTHEFSFKIGGVYSPFTIREAILGDYPEILNQNRDEV